MIKKRIIAAACALTMGVGMVDTAAAGQMDTAFALMEKGQYREAAASFDDMQGYPEAARYAAYCQAMEAMELGLYDLAKLGFYALRGFLDSDALYIYTEALEAEQNEDYETETEKLAQIFYFRDSETRILSLPDKISARDYRRACDYETKGLLEAAYELFSGLGNYLDSPSRAASVKQDMLHKGDYDAADRAEINGDYETAWEGFSKLAGFNYKDSAARAAAALGKLQAERYNKADAA